MWAHLPAFTYFAIEWEYSKTPAGRFFIRYGKAVALSPTSPFSLRRLLARLRAGHSVVMFPEGKITVTGSPMNLYPGAAWLAAKAGVPLRPLWLHGMERTPLSYLNHLQNSRWRVRASLSAADPLVPQPSATRPGRAGLVARTKEAFERAMEASPAFSRPLAALLSDATTRFGKGFWVIQEGNRLKRTLGEIGRNASSGSGPTALLSASLAAWRSGRGLEIQGGWWDPPRTIPSDGGLDLRLGGRSLTGRDIRLAEARLRWRAGLRIGDRLFVDAPLSPETFLLGLLSPLIAGSRSLFSSPPGVAVRPVSDDVYDRDASVYLTTRAGLAAFAKLADESRTNLRLVLLAEDEITAQDEALALRVCGVRPRLMPILGPQAASSSSISTT